MDRKTRMTVLLEEALNPSMLVIRDDSARHQHHAHMRSVQENSRGPAQVGETHYAVEIVSDKFDEMRALARHRLVNELLAPEFEQGLHALSLTLKGTKDV
ncbi:BolA/IbaG family iron-sulfur metabolism protein [Saccharibacter sp. 17.LH.SD]|uniref:BolA family protein n=1 Tax=Saccharibacter sp. 17.LH.SD TaxID=2689393 RepID=UPI00136D123B|nr:BolA family protein [Saccharibacter sp. 17.LH.SD]MXV44586.1 BolA/IbaG family iron-sulfur metabolism protein [Saccharibacter sp. 17.LH.SD]